MDQVETKLKQWPWLSEHSCLYHVKLVNGNSVKKDIIIHLGINYVAYDESIDMIAGWLMILHGGDNNIS